MTERKSNIDNNETVTGGRSNFLNARFHQSILMISVITSLITLPVFIALYKYVPKIVLPVGGGFRLDHVLLFSIIFILIYLFVKTFRLYIYMIAIAGLVVMTITNFSGIYTLSDFGKDYKSFLYALSEGAVEKEKKEIAPSIAIELKLREAIDYQNSIVRDYAVNTAVKHFKNKEVFSGNYKLVQYFSVFKEVVNIWTYVNDPGGEDYYSKASETIRLLNSDGLFKGDCDDYSILIGALIKAIGGEVRLVRSTIINSQGNEIGHLYPEVKVGVESDMKEISYLIKTILFPEEANGKKLNYYLDPKGYIWLNFDYNDNYPGGRYQSEIRNSTIRI